MVCTGALDGSGWLCCPVPPGPSAHPINQLADSSRDATECSIKPGSLCMFDAQCNATSGCESWICNVPGSEGRRFCGPPVPVGSSGGAENESECPIKPGSLCTFDT